MAQLAEKSIPPPEVHSLNTVIGNCFYRKLIYYQLHLLVENKEKEAAKGPIEKNQFRFCAHLDLRRRRLLLKISASTTFFCRTTKYFLHNLILAAQLSNGQPEHRRRPLILPSVTRKKLPNVYKSCPKMISLEK